VTDPAARRKRLGQYFTPAAVGRLLAALARAADADTVIDPMAGAGHLLAACLDIGARPAALCGLDIDPIAVQAARAALPGATVSVGDAFAAAYPATPFQLVVTNPPYVRYQSTTLGASFDVTLPSAAQVRRDLRAFLARYPGVAGDARAVLLAAADRYSGLADLAVPCWLLAAALVAPGGRLALVAPQAWLSRDYAEPVRAVLGTLFDLEYVVEDTDAAWFADALVRTTLVVARRGEPARHHLRVRLGRAAAGAGGLVGRHFATEQDFAARAAAWRRAGRPVAMAGITAAPATLTGPALPHELAELVTEPDRLTDLAGLGWRAGQGLRTGANDFFYQEAVAGQPDHVRTSSGPVGFPPGVTLPVLRRQTDLPPGYAVPPDCLSARVLYLRGWATRPDWRTAARHGFGPALRELGPDASRFVVAAARWTIRTAAGERPLPELTAVAPNHRPVFDRPDRPPTFWYQLPELADRHRPELALSRVCGNAPRTYLLRDRKVVLDANFAALWRSTSDALDEYAMLALLNSTLTVATLESVGNVLGGGALKLEAAHLRRIAVCRPGPPHRSRLAELGRRLCAGDGHRAALAEIDEIVAATVNPADPAGSRAGVAAVAAGHLSRRRRVLRSGTGGPPGA
jgi:N-6 DNA methylase